MRIVEDYIKRQSSPGDRKFYVNVKDKHGQIKRCEPTIIWTLDDDFPEDTDEIILSVDKEETPEDVDLLPKQSITTIQPEETPKLIIENTMPNDNFIIETEYRILCKNCDYQNVTIKHDINDIPRLYCPNDNSHFIIPDDIIKIRRKFLPLVIPTTPDDMAYTLKKLVTIHNASNRYF